MAKTKQKVESFWKGLKEIFVTIIRETKDTPHALVSSLVALVLIVFILYGSALCSLSQMGKEYCWLGVLMVISGMSAGAFMITWISLKKRK